MSSLTFSSSSLSSLLPLAGALMPVALLAGLLWVTATKLDAGASHSKRKQTVPGAWDSDDDEHLLFSSPPPSRSPSVSRTLSSSFSSLFPFSKPRSISSTSLVVSCSAPHPPSLFPASLPPQKRPSARASSTGVSQTSTFSKADSHLTISQSRSSLLRDEAVSKASRRGLSTFKAVDNVLYGRWPLSHAIDQSAKALAAPGRKNFPTSTRPLADDDAVASLALALKSLSLSSPEKNEVSYKKPAEEAKFIKVKTEVNTVALIENPAGTTLIQPEPAPSALVAPTFLAAKLRYDGFRCGLAPLAAFSRLFQPAQPVQPEPPVLIPSPPVVLDTSPMEWTNDGPQSSQLTSDVSEPLSLSTVMHLDTKPSVSTPKPTITGIVQNAVQTIQQFVAPQFQPSFAPVDISSLVEVMARLSLNDKKEISVAQTVQPASARPRQLQRKIKPLPSSTQASRQSSSTVPARSPAEQLEWESRRKALTVEVHKRRLQATAGKQSTSCSSSSLSSSSSSSSSSSVQPSSVPATSSPAKTEKKIASTTLQTSSTASSKSSPKHAAPAAPAAPQRPSGQLSLPVTRPRSLFAPVRKSPPVAATKSTSSSSSVQSSSAKATVIPTKEDKKKQTTTPAKSQPLRQPAASTQASGQPSSAPAPASTVNTETKKLAKMGTVNPAFASILDDCEAEETAVKAKEKSTPKPKPKPEPMPEPKPDPEEDEMSNLDDLESQLAMEQMEELNNKKKVVKFKGEGRKIAPLKKRK
ncbi:hypothetical protein J7T55_013284 [Diaporthe amygdali]|uniref:uncharacterized protein n=1 Tax=Phomopsis amygdali TaxID=1214568 RepID=UPI0022FEACC2|nr:uncharacterized protein J7T55_013284 [Diaporthe amygdali]KAJ0119049.1 hypothetical protein J7T55_013284 [Diaporthe amygdali]